MCWCALDEATIANVCLWMIMGSHRHGVTGREGWQRYEPVDGVEPPEARPIELALGSCSFHHGLILYASRPNLTDPTGAMPPTTQARTAGSTGSEATT